MNTYSTAYARLTQGRAQAAYEARVRAFGLPALLAPYGGADLAIPTQRSQSAAPVV